MHHLCASVLSESVSIQEFLLTEDVESLESPNVENCGGEITVGI